jgi:hypothetical protein
MLPSLAGQEGRIASDGEHQMREFRCPFRQLILLSLVVLFALINAHAASAQSTWASIGPEGGPVNALAIDPTTPTTLYAGTGVQDPLDLRREGGGVFKSTDGGASWTALNTGLTNLDVRVLPGD